ncbi:MAG TPA: hypothetical protein VHC69_13160 [Polyangiaceae bacterium]|nr:hypothetical protein [Polyangiaceae bacterium]
MNSTGIFYFLKWYTPIGAAEGPGAALMHLPNGASEPVRLANVAGGASGDRQDLVVTQTAAIYGEAQDGGSGEGAVLSVSSGKEPVTLASTKGLAYALVADEHNVYFVDDEGTKSVPLSGGPVRTLASRNSASILVSGSTLYLGDATGQGNLVSVPIDGGPVTVLASESALDPIMCGASVCWLNGPALASRLRQLVPGGSPTTLATGLSEPHDLIFDGNYFFTTIGAGVVFLARIPADGGRVDIIQQRGLATSLALDDACLYWSEASGIYSWALSAAGQAPAIASDGGS